MEPHTLLMLGFVVFAAVMFVTARVGRAALGALPAVTSVGGANARDAEPDAGDGDEGASAARDDDEWGASRITADDHERIRNHLEKDPFRRSPDDLLPSDEDES